MLYSKRESQARNFLDLSLKMIDISIKISSSLLSYQKVQVSIKENQKKQTMKSNIEIEQQTLNALCLNPQCTSNSRLCQLVVCNHKVFNVDQNHYHCQGWLLDLSEDQSLYAFEDPRKLQDEPDFLKQPLGSIQKLAGFSHSDWKQEIDQIMSDLKKKLVSKLSEVKKKIQSKIEKHLNKANQIKQDIIILKNETLKNGWTFDHSQFYRQRLSFQLIDIQKCGYLRPLNNEGLCYEILKIQSEIQEIENFFWVQQSKYDLSQRNKTKICYQQLLKLMQIQQIQIVVRNLQEIQSQLKIKNFSFKSRKPQMKSSEISLICERCNFQIVPEVNNQIIKSKHAKKSECIYGLYRHYCQSHSLEVMEKYIKKTIAQKQRMSFKQVLRQVSLSKAKICVVIDRQNINAAKEMQSNDIYVIEVVSQTRENIATGRYLIAESSGKDAADILIILLLFELSKVNPKKTLWLITNDHFGKTLKPIFRSLGATYNLASKFCPEVALSINKKIPEIGQGFNNIL